MGLFSKLKENKEEKARAKEENAHRLADFNPTMVVGIDDPGPLGDAMAECILIDEAQKAFVVAQSVQSDFRNTNPWIIGFDQVEKAEMHIEEYWSENYSWGQKPLQGFGNLTLDRYDEVYWCYNFIMEMKTTHPYAKNLSCQFNGYTLGTKVPTKGIFARRGLEIGCYVKESGAAIEKADQYDAKAEDEAAWNAKVKRFDILTLQRPDTIFGKMMADGENDFRVAIMQYAAFYLREGAKFLEQLGR